MTSPILITGVPRSGTSLVTGCFNLCGAWVGKTVGATKDNPKGFFENLSIREDVVKGYLNLKGFDKLGQNPLPPLQDEFTSEDFKQAPYIRQKVNQILQMENYEKGLWAFKDAKLSLIWPIWAAAYPEAKWIIVRREKIKIAESCMKTGFMRAYSTKAEWVLWVASYEQRFEALKRNCKFHEIWFGDLVTGNLNGLEAAIKDCGLIWDREKVEDFIIKR